MSDPISAALWHEIQQHQGEGLWLLDEHVVGSPRALPEGLELVTNRWDCFTRWQSLAVTHFSDFNLSCFPEGGYDHLYYRLSKEKPVVHHVINQAARLLKPGGRLWLAGGKQEGMKTYFSKAVARLGVGDLHKLGKGDFLAELTREGLPGDALDDSRYGELRIVEVDGESFYSKPGLFGWEKIDQGSRYLVDSLASVWQRLPETPRVLDLGCGYGFLSLQCIRLGAGGVVATDNNAAALFACQRNLDGVSIETEVVAADAGDCVAGNFDLVICNPPFHQGFAVEGELTDRFLASAARHLSPQGQAAFVVNQFIPLERKASEWFAEVDTFASNGRFKLIRLAKPRLDAAV